MTASRSPASFGAAVFALSATVLTFAACGSDIPDPPVTVQRLAFDTLFTIGTPGGEAWEAFDGIWDIEVDFDGRIAVLDLGGPVVHVYSAEGAHLGSIDERGLDEGQLDAPSAIAWRGPGELVVWDPGSSWVSEFVVDEAGVRFVERWRAFAFGETGFCAAGDRTWLSYWQDDQVIHEVGPDGIVASFGDAPDVAGGESLGPELLEIAVEELTPSALVCTPQGILDVSFVQSLVRLHAWDGTGVWARPIRDLVPVRAYSDDGVGLGRAFDPEGSSLLRSVVPWGAGLALVQHEVRTREFPEEGEVEVFESRLIRIVDGVEIDRTRALPLILAAHHNRLFLTDEVGAPRIVAVAVREQ